MAEMPAPYLPEFWDRWCRDMERSPMSKNPLSFGTATVRTSAGVDVAAIARLAATAPHTLGVGPKVQGPAVKPISEKAFQADVVKLAKLHGWKVYHTFDSRRSQKGYPDLTLVRDRVIVAELKAESGKTTREQADWLGAFHRAGVTACVWRPSDWASIEKTLSEVTR